MMLPVAFKDEQRVEFPSTTTAGTITPPSFTTAKLREPFSYYNDHHRLVGMNSHLPSVVAALRICRR